MDQVEPRGQSNDGDGDAAPQPHELVSALVDGQLRGEALNQALALLRSSAPARAAWSDYHVVREALQSGQAQVSRDDAQFLAGLRARLTQPETPAPGEPSGMTTVHPEALRAAANDGRWRRVVGLASIAMVGLLAWRGGMVPTPAAPPAPAALAQSSAVPAPLLTLTPLESEPVFAATQAVMIRDPRLDAWLQTHRPLEPVLQAPSDFLRNATFGAGRR